MEAVPYIRWLHAEASDDADRDGHFASLYQFGPYLSQTFGDAEPDLAAFSSYLERNDYQADAIERLCGCLALSIATWRTDTSEVANPEAVEVRQPPCGYRGVDGARCSVPSVPGAARCIAHGGAITDPQVRASMLLIAYANMVTGSDTAVHTLINVMEHSTNDLARVQAAKEMLDRAGLTAEQRIQITSDEASTSRSDVLERVRAILDSTKERLVPPQIEPDDDEIIDAELVE